MTDGSSALARDSERSKALARVAFEMRIFAFGTRSDQKRKRILELVDEANAIRGNGYFSGQLSVAGARMTARLDRIEQGDKAEWLRLIQAWSDDTNSFTWAFEPGSNEYAVALGWASEQDYQRFRQKAEQCASIPATSMLFFCEVGGASWLKASRELYRKAMTLLNERGWRTLGDGTYDRYALLLGPHELFDIVWLGCGRLDAHNCGPDVVGGPEVFRISKPRAA